MTIEIYWLLLSILLTALLWVPYIINRLFEQGILYGLWDPDGKTESKVGWARRLMAAHTNAIENLVIFASLVIILHQLEISTQLTETAAMLYFFSRLAHVILFAFRVPVLRIVTFLSGFGAQMMLFFTLFTVA